MAEEVAPEVNNEQPLNPAQEAYQAAKAIDPRLLSINTGGNESFNPMPKSGPIKKEIVGNPIVGANPGLKYSDINTGNYANALGDFMEQTAHAKPDYHEYMKPYTFNGDHDGAIFERYYGTKQFNKLGFNPYRNNDALYNQNRTFGDDFVRAAGQWPSLMKSGIMSGIRTWGDLFTDPLAPDLESAKEMQRAMAIGSSTKGGMGGFINNTFLNSAYTVGIGAEFLLEELALAGITAATGGVLSEMTIPLMGARALKGTHLAMEGAKVAEETLSGMKIINNINDVRTMWNTVGKTAGKIGAAFNPLENTWEVGKEIFRGTNALQYTGAGGKVNQLLRASDNFGRVAKDILMTKTAVSEAKLEGGMVQMDVIKNLTEQYRQEHNGVEPTGDEVVKIENMAKAEARRTALWNLPAIMWSNKLMYETLFAPFEKGIEKAAATTAFDAAAEKGSRFTKAGDSFLERVSATKAALLKPKTYSDFTLGYMKTNVAEGVQENIQEAISQGAIRHATELYTNPNKGMYQGYLSHFLQGMKDQVSAQGAETFAGGFLMGAMAQPAMSAPMWAWKTTWDSYKNSQGYTDKQKLKDPDYKSYQELRNTQVAEQLKTLNEFDSNPQNFIAPDIHNLLEQDELASNMYDAIQEGNKNKARDIQDISGAKHILTALRTGHYDDVMKNFDDWKQMTPEEAVGAFLNGKGTEADGVKILSKLDFLEKRAKEVKKNYDEVSANYPNPYNPSNFKPGSADFNAQAYAQEAWERAKSNLILGRQSFIDHGKRLEEMATELTGASKPLDNVSAQDLMVLLNPRDTKKEVQLLRADIAGLDKTVPGQGKIIKQKEDRLKVLETFAEAIHRENVTKEIYKTAPTDEVFVKKGKALVTEGDFIKAKGNKNPLVVTSLDISKKGNVIGYKTIDLITQEEVTVKTKDVDHIDPLEARDTHLGELDSRSRNSFTDYIKHISKDTGDFVFNDKVDKAYGIIKDHMLVRDEMNYIVEGINVLNNPKGFLRLQHDLQTTLASLHANLAETNKKNILEFVNRVQGIAGVNDLMEASGMVVTDKYWEYFVKTVREGKEPVAPTEFKDAKTGEIITTGEKFDKAMTSWNNTLEAIKNPPLQEEIKTEVEEVVIPEEPALTDKDKVDVTKDFHDLYVALKLPPVLHSQIEDLIMQADVFKGTEEENSKALEQFFKDNQVKIAALVQTHNDSIGQVKPEVKPVAVTPVVEPVPVVTPAPVVTKTEPVEEKTTSGVSDKQKVAFNKAKALQEKGKKITKNAEGRYVVDGIPVNYRVTEVAALIIDEKFDFTNSRFFRNWLKVFNQAPKGATAEQIVSLLKTDNRTKAAFQAEDGKVAFTPEKIDKLINGIKDEKGNELIPGLSTTNTEANFIALMSKLAYEESTIRGNSVDEAGREFFSTGKFKKPEGMDQDAYEQLTKIFHNFKSKIETAGGIILTNDLKVYGEKQADISLAGEMDVLVINANGEFEIYDFKTSDKWGGFKNASNRTKYGVQLSLYKNLLESMTGIKVTAMHVIPIETKTASNGDVLSVKDPLRNTPETDFELAYNSKVEAWVPTLKDVVVTKPSVTKRPSSKEGLQAVKDILSKVSSLTDISVAVNKAQAAMKNIVEQMVNDGDFEQAALMDDTINKLTNNRVNELLTMVNKDTLSWAKVNNLTVNFVTDEPVVRGNNYSIVKINKDTATLSKLGETYDVLFKDITINKPGEVAQEATITQEEVKDNLKEGAKAIENLKDTLPEHNALKKDSLDDLNNKLKKKC